MRDLTVNKIVKENETTGLIESQEIQTLQKGDQIHIEDITSSKIQIIDNMEKVYQVVEQMKSLYFNNDFGDYEDK